MKYERTNIPGFVKDTKHNVVINNNLDEYKRILDKRQHKKELDSVKNEVKELQDELNDMRKLKKELAELIKNLKEK